MATEQTDITVTLSSLLDFQAINRSALARRLGVSKVTLSDWEHGRRGCPSHQQLRLGDVLGVPHHVLFNERGIAR